MGPAETEASVRASTKALTGPQAALPFSDYEPTDEVLTFVPDQREASLVVTLVQYWNGGIPQTQHMYVGEMDVVVNPAGLPTDAGGRPYLGLAPLDAL